MKFAAIAMALGVLLPNAGLAPSGAEGQRQPTAFEAFAAQPAAHVTWSKRVGEIDGTESRIAVTAVVIEDGMQPSHRMRGVRIDLANQRATDRVYLSEEKLAAVNSALDEIDAEIAAFRSEPSSTPYRYLGAAEFWHPDVKIHTLCAAYYIAPDSSGLSVSACAPPESRLPNHRPAELAQAIRRAIDELRQR